MSVPSIYLEIRSEYRVPNDKNKKLINIIENNDIDELEKYEVEDLGRLLSEERISGREYISDVKTNDNQNAVYFSFYDLAALCNSIDCLIYMIEVIDVELKQTDVEKNYVPALYYAMRYSAEQTAVYLVEMIDEISNGSFAAIANFITNGRTGDLIKGSLTCIKLLERCRDIICQRKPEVKVIPGCSREYLAFFYDLFYSDSSSVHPIFTAINSRSEDAVEFFASTIDDLSSLEGDRVQRNTISGDPLSEALFCNCDSLIEKLLPRTRINEKHVVFALKYHDNLSLTVLEKLLKNVDLNKVVPEMRKGSNDNIPVFFNFCKFDNENAIEIIKMLERHGCDFRIRSSSGKCYLRHWMRSIHNGFQEQVITYLSRYFDDDICDECKKKVGSLCREHNNRSKKNDGGSDNEFCEVCNKKLTCADSVLSHLPLNHV